MGVRDRAHNIIDNFCAIGRGKRLAIVVLLSLSFAFAVVFSIVASVQLGRVTAHSRDLAAAHADLELSIETETVRDGTRAAVMTSIVRGTRLAGSSKSAGAMATAGSVALTTFLIIVILLLAILSAYGARRYLASSSASAK